MIIFSFFSFSSFLKGSEGSFDVGGLFGSRMSAGRAEHPLQGPWRLPPLRRGTREESSGAARLGCRAHPVPVPRCGIETITGNNDHGSPRCFVISESSGFVGGDQRCP